MQNKSSPWNDFVFSLFSEFLSNFFDHFWKIRSMRWSHVYFDELWLTSCLWLSFLEWIDSLIVYLIHIYVYWINTRRDKFWTKGWKCFTSAELSGRSINQYKFRIEGFWMFQVAMCSPFGTNIEGLDLLSHFKIWKMMEQGSLW